MFICTFCLRVSFNICRLMYIWISDVAVSDGVQCAWFLPRARCLLDWMLWSFISGVKIEDFQKLAKYLTVCAHTARRDVWGASFCPCETFREKPQKIRPCAKSNKGLLMHQIRQHLLFDQLLRFARLCRLNNVSEAFLIFRV